MKIKQQFILEMEMEENESIENAEVRLYEELSDALRETSLKFSYGNDYPEVG